MKLIRKSTHHDCCSRRGGVLSANLIAVVALVFSLGVGTAYAVTLANGSVKTRHLAAGAVTDAKIKSGTISEGKLTGSVTAKLNRVRVGSPVRVGMTTTSDVNAAPLVRVLTIGAYTVYGRCWTGSSGYGSARLYVQSSQSGALLNTSFQKLVGSGGAYPQANQLVPVSDVSTVAASNGANVFSGAFNAVYGGKVVRVDANAWVRADAAGQSTPNYNSSRCVFQARAVSN